MKRLIRLQLRNVFHNKLFYVCLSLTLLMSPIMSFALQLIIPGSSSEKILPQIIDFLSSELSIISIVFIALFCCFDFNEGTTKNIIARGYTKTELLISKYISTLISLFLMYIITSLLTAILFINNGLGFNGNMGYLFIHDIFKIIALTIFFATISFLLEKNGAAIIACIFVPNVISLLLSMIDSHLKLNISNYWISNISTIFTKNPTLSNLSLSSLYYLIYIVIIVLIGVKLLKKKEIK